MTDLMDYIMVKNIFDLDTCERYINRLNKNHWAAHQWYDNGKSEFQNHKDFTVTYDIELQKEMTRLFAGRANPGIRHGEISSGSTHGTRQRPCSEDRFAETTRLLTQVFYPEARSVRQWTRAGVGNLGSSSSRCRQFLSACRAHRTNQTSL